ncbi:WxL domain-containing protein [Enterococcus rivorum]|uniref:WxL domain-containing protein n=1 Tax=Enterococcus rivorum TaxID=762845 RepID=UPI00362C3145
MSGLCGVLLLSMRLSSLEVYATESNGQTKSDAAFEAGDRPSPGKPEEGPKDPSTLDPDVDPEDPTKPKPLPESGNVYVTHLPTISFGSNKTKVETSEYGAVMEKRTKNEGKIGFYMPHSIQVADLSGKGDSKWSVSVQQEDVFKTSDNKLQLTDSRIRLYGNTLTNSSYKTEDLSGKIDGVNMEQKDKFGTYAQIPLASDKSSLTILNSKTEGFTLNSYTSSVFHQTIKKVIMMKLKHQRNLVMKVSD